MEGYLLLPPERGIIIGRAVWKSRFIVLGSAVRQPTTNDSLPRSMSSSRLQAARKGLKNAASKPSLIDTQTGSEQQTYLTVYKHQGDAEPLHRISISSIKSCEIQNMQYKKQGPPVPTLVINIELDAAAEKTRKRRSSRAASLSVMTAPLEQLLLRTVHEEQYTISDWHASLQPYLRDYRPVDHIPMTPITPISPAFNAFTNPFSPNRPSTATARPELIHRMSNLTYVSTHSTRDRPSAITSRSPSLRSRRSDLSSQASSHPSHPTYTYQNPISNTLPADLPSPSYAFDEKFVEGWTVSQGRSSALSNHTRGSNSVASTPSVIPRESILDRALQIRSMSISQQSPQFDEEQSSIARFEAMMREIDERKNKAKSASAASTTRPNVDPDYDSENDDILEEDEQICMDTVNIPTPAQRALEYISGGRSTPLSRPMSPTSPRKNSISSNMGLQPRPRGSRPRSMAPPASNLSPPSTASPPAPPANSTSIREKRTSSSSSKRLSFNEFTRRLSSTSSLLLVQTNASLSSSAGSIERGSSEASFGGEEEFTNQKGLRHSNLVGRERCNWRGSVGVFGGEGGFL